MKPKSKSKSKPAPKPLAEYPEFLTVDEFAEFMRINRNLVYDLVKAGEVDHVKFGRLIRIPKRVLVGQ